MVTREAAMAKRTNRVAWGLAGGVAAALLVGAWPLYRWSRSVWVARHRGKGAALHHALLILAPLQGINLESADLQEAILLGSNLAGANLTSANLNLANLTGANLAGADLGAA